MPAWRKFGWTFWDREADAIIRNLHFDIFIERDRQIRTIGPGVVQDIILSFLCNSIERKSNFA